MGRPRYSNEGRRRSFLVSIEAPEGATDPEIRQYIIDNVQAGCGCLHPDDPMSRLDRGSVRVRKWFSPGDRSDPMFESRERDAQYTTRRRGEVSDV